MSAHVFMVLGIGYLSPCKRHDHPENARMGLAAKKHNKEAYSMDPVQWPKLTLSIPEAAKVLGISDSHMYQLAKTDGFPTVQIGERRILISAKGLERWVEEKAQQGWCPGN